MSIQKMEDLRAKNKAAFEAVREMIANAGVSQSNQVITSCLDFLGKSAEEGGREAIELNTVFRFSVFAGNLLIIPHSRFAGNDMLVLTNFKNPAAWELHKVEFYEDRFLLNPGIYFPDYLKATMRRGMHRDCAEE